VSVPLVRVATVPKLFSVVMSLPPQDS
jgi:hypothetical protein